MYDDEELEEIQNEFRRKELLTHSLGPSISLILHIVLFLALFFVVKAKIESEEPDVVITVEKEATEEVIETPDDLDEITEVELESSETAETDAPAEETPDDVNTDVSEETLDIPDTDLAAFEVDNNSPYVTRTLQGKAIQVAKGGGDKRALSTVLSALKWLRANQNPDGSWGTGKAKGGISALATLLYLAHGETPTSKHFGKTVQKALKWIAQDIKTLKPGPSDNRRELKYSLAMETYALAEGYSLTGIKDLEESMNLGVKQLFNSMNPNGWADYNPSTPDDRDLSMTGWYFQAFKAAYLAGCEDKKMIDYIKTIPNKVKANGYNVYKPTSKSPMNSFQYRTHPQWKVVWYGENGGDIIQKSSAVRAIGALVLQLYGKKSDAQAAANVIAKEDIKKLDANVSQGFPIYSWYYATQVIYNNKSSDPAAWRRWNSRFQKLLYDTQHKDGYWETRGTRPEIPGFLGTGIDRKVYSTALCGLMLTVYYRYLPTTTLKPPKKSKAVTADSSEVDLDFL